LACDTVLKDVHTCSKTFSLILTKKTSINEFSSY
jgi:hypothetical protein